MSEKKGTWGGARKGAGRPLQAGELRKGCTMKATTEEWEIIKRFAKLLKYGKKEACIKALEELERE